MAIGIVPMNRVARTMAVVRDFRLMPMMHNIVFTTVSVVRITRPIGSVPEVAAFIPTAVFKITSACPVASDPSRACTSSSWNIV